VCDSQKLLGYAKWENFSKVVEKAITSCHKSGYKPSGHFAEIRKMVVEKWAFVFNIDCIIIVGRNSSRTDKI